jgi:hypothetical protein
MRCSIFVAQFLGLAVAALAGLAACAPTYVADAPNGDRSVTTYSRAFGLDATSLNNREAVLDACRARPPRPSRRR